MRYSHAFHDQFGFFEKGFFGFLIPHEVVMVFLVFQVVKS